jgi:hypothetical protein
MNSGSSELQVNNDVVDTKERVRRDKRKKVEGRSEDAKRVR